MVSLGESNLIFQQYVMNHFQFQDEYVPSSYEQLVISTESI